MRYTTKTEYAILCMVYLAKHSDRKFITVKEMSEHGHYPSPFVEKIFQALKKAQLVRSSTGQTGGYTLTQDPDKITIKEIIEAIEGSTFETFCESAVKEDLACAGFCLCGVKPVWRKTKQMLDQFYASVTLKTLMSDEIGVQKQIAGVVA